MILQIENEIEISLLDRFDYDRLLLCCQYLLAVKVSTESSSVGRAAAAKEVDASTSAADMTADSGE